ncbi:cell division protein FtsZ [Candidatus Babeliales bacterium]|nr:cell division protein FtsZ [Candidatus Babeliales bacterium]
MIELNLEEEENKIKLGACLKVVGIGGAGGNAVNSMIGGNELETVDFVVANTDAQALSLSNAAIKIQLGAKITKGLGAGSNPDIGRRAAEEDLDAILGKISGSDILFLTAGLGGGTGSGALPVISKAAKEQGILTVAIVTTPFSFEGRRRLNHAQEAIESLKECVDTLIVIPNQKLLEISDPKISMLEAFAFSDDVLKKAVKGISDIITKAGHINVDFADVREIMKDMGMAIMGTGIAEGEDRARQAALNAISSPLLEDISINGAKGVLINITGNTDLGLQEINEAASLIHEMVSKDAEIILGSVIDQNIGNQIMVTVIATGFQSEIVKEKIKEKEVSVEMSQEDKRSICVNSTEKEEVTNFDILLNDERLKLTPGNLSDDSFDMKNLDTPTYLRKQAQMKIDQKSEKKEEKIKVKEEKIDQVVG